MFYQCQSAGNNPYIDVDCFLSGTSGAVAHGTNYTLSLAYEHNMKRTTFSFCYGPFGGVKSK